MEENKNTELLASILLTVIDQNRDAQESIESDEWKLGYHEACDMVLAELQKLQ